MLDRTKLYKAHVLISYQGQTRHSVTDLQCDEGQWYLVFEWTTNHDGEFPSLRHPVDEHLLKPLQGDIVVIEFPIHIPESAEMTANFHRPTGQ